VSKESYPTRTSGGRARGEASATARNDARRRASLVRREKRGPGKVSKDFEGAAIGDLDGGRPLPQFFLILAVWPVARFALRA